MDWNDTIVLKTKDQKSVVIPRSEVRYVGTYTKKDYTLPGPDYNSEVTVIHLPIEWAEATGMDVKYASIFTKVIQLELDMELKVVLGLLRGDKAAEVLF